MEVFMTDAQKDLDNKKIQNLTNKSYWEDQYNNNDNIDVNEYKFDCVSIQILNAIKKYMPSRGSVLEMGAGSSDFIILLAKFYVDVNFTGIDYTKNGCEKLISKAKFNGVDNITVLERDFLDYNKEIKGNYDIVYSLGVVEHFYNTENIIEIFSKYVKKGGVLVTVIPNMCGLTGFLTKLMNKSVYELHNTIDRNTLKQAHNESKFNVEFCNYLAFINFGVLSSCVIGDKSWLIKILYLFLWYFTKITWAMEKIFGKFASNKITSPFILCIARRIE